MSVVEVERVQHQGAGRDKAYYTISEVSRMVGVPSHVLRFWETQFTQLRPMKSRGRRYYAQKDIKLLQNIRAMLHDQGYTIKGVQRQLANGPLDSGVLTASLRVNEKECHVDGESERDADIMKAVYRDLLAIRSLLDTADEEVEFQQAA